jgi:hypothetical protein
LVSLVRGVCTISVPLYLLFLLRICRQTTARSVDLLSGRPSYTTYSQHHNKCKPWGKCAVISLSSSYLKALSIFSISFASLHSFLQTLVIYTCLRTGVRTSGITNLNTTTVKGYEESALCRVNLFISKDILNLLGLIYITSLNLTNLIYVYSLRGVQGEEILDTTVIGHEESALCKRLIYS